MSESDLLTFGDPESIRKRNRGREAAIKAHLKCPNCKGKNIVLKHVFSDWMSWRCPSYKCNFNFTTDIVGKLEKKAGSEAEKPLPDPVSMDLF